MLDQRIIDLIIEAEKEKRKVLEQGQRIPLTIDEPYWGEPTEEEIVEKPKRGVVVIDI